MKLPHFRCSGPRKNGNTSPSVCSIRQVAKNRLYWFCILLKKNRLILWEFLLIWLYLWAAAKTWTDPSCQTRTIWRTAERLWRAGWCGGTIFATLPIGTSYGRYILCRGHRMSWGRCRTLLQLLGGRSPSRQLCNALVLHLLQVILYDFFTLKRNKSLSTLDALVFHPNTVTLPWLVVPCLFDIAGVLFHCNLLYRALKTKERFDVQASRLLEAGPVLIVRVYLQVII